MCEKQFIVNRDNFARLTYLALLPMFSLDFILSTRFQFTLHFNSIKLELPMVKKGKNCL